MSPEAVEYFSVPHVPGLFAVSAAHWMMVYDAQRTGAYQRAIARTVRPGDVVVDIGTGTGLLAFLSARAGARRVHAIERSPTVLKWAEDLARANGFADRITFYLGDSRTISLPEKAQVIVSELIGYLAFDEGIVATLFDARERFLEPGGQVIPRVVTLYAAPVSERNVYPSYVDGWVPVEGIDYSLMRRHAVGALYSTWLTPEDVLAAPQPIFTADFLRGRRPRQEMVRRFPVLRPGIVNGLGLWFGATLADGAYLCSDPYWTTHWGQSFAPLHTPLRVGIGDVLRVSFFLKISGGDSAGCQFAVQVSREHGGP